MHLDLPTSITPAQQTVITEVVSGLAAVDGVHAVVLGGSHARGSAHAESDVDLGVYYLDERPFSIDRVRELAEKCSTGRAAVVTDLYEWGPWVNGGAWLHTPAGKFDVVFRSIDDVRRTINEAKRGSHQRHYDQQPAHGFYSVIYLAETRDCQILYDPAGVILGLKEEVTDYPQQLRKAVIADALWAAEFSLYVAKGFARRGDVYGASGCLGRIAAYLTQALFALNEAYFPGDKEALQTIDGFDFAPTQYPNRIRQLLGCPGDTAEDLSTTIASMRVLWEEVAGFAGPAYTPKYPLPTD